MPAPASAESPAATRAINALVVVLFVLVAIYAAWPVVRATLPLVIDDNEAWNGWHADSLLAGRPLYPDPGGLTVNNYPPLSFVLVAVLSKLSGVDPVYVGRFASLAGLLAAALAVAAIVRAFGGTRLAATIGAVWFGATLVRFFDRYAGMDDPNLPALGLMAWALAWLVGRRGRGGSVEPAIALMVVAGFFKHSLVAIPIATLIWLALEDRRVALRAAVTGAALSVAGLALCIAIFGPAFVPNLLMPRVYSLVRGLMMLRGLHAIAPALVIVGLWLYHRRAGPARRFAVVFVAVTFAGFFLEGCGEGVDVNAQFELDVALGVALAFAFDDVAAIPAARGWSVAGQRVAILAVLAARLVIAEQTTPYLFIGSNAFRAEVAGRAAVAEREIARVAALPPATVCSAPLICRWAGKPFLIDVFYVAQALRTGRLSADEVARRRAAQHLTEASIDPRVLKPLRALFGTQQ